jgi:anti-sigma B factor antagonist
MGQTVTMEEGEASVAVTGEFDMSATFTVEPALERALDAPGLRAIELDLSGVTFIDSTGIGVVLWLNGESESRRLPLRIVPGPTEVQRVFETAGLADALPFAPA